MISVNLTIFKTKKKEICLKMKHSSDIYVIGLVEILHVTIYETNVMIF